MWRIVEKDNFVTIQKQNLHLFATGMFKAISLSIVDEILDLNEENNYYLTNLSDFILPIRKTVFNGLETWNI